MQDIVTELRQAMGGAYSQLKQHREAINRQSGEAALLRQEIDRMKTELAQLSAIAGNVSGGRVAGGSDGGVHGQVKLRDRDDLVYIDEIPGRRIPFDLIVRIPIGATVTTEQQQTTTISQTGPFVATSRYIAFLSQLRYTKLIEGQRVDFQGRSFGRWRPTHSMLDYNDAQAMQPVVGLANPGTGGPIYASPSNHSGFRTMQFDGRVKFLNQGSAYFRHGDVPVPSCFYTEAMNSVFQLGSFDFFERGETLQWFVTPTHQNNPIGGNVSGFLAGGVFPALDSQYDVHEGILDEFDSELTSDPVVRVPDGIVEIGFHGFRIVQPIGPVG